MDSNYPGGSDGNFNVKEELQAIPSSPPQPVEGLQSSRPPPFLTKIYDMVEDPLTNSVVSWSGNQNSFIVWNSHQFSMDLLPKYFKHNNFSSFVRQLNTYGFRKVDPDRWEFANEGFLRGQKHLLKHIQRRRPPSQGQQHQPGMGACVEVGQFGMDGEIKRLRRDKGVLMMEVVRLRQQQQSTRTQLQTMAQRIQATEQRQQQMMTFLARAMRNPTFLSQLVQKNHVNKHLAGAKKRRRLPQGAGGDTDQPPPQRAQREIIKFHGYSRSTPSEPPGTPLEALLPTLEQANLADDYRAAEESFHEDFLRQEEEMEGLMSPTEFEQLQGFEHETAAFGDTVSLGIADASGHGSSSSSLAGTNRDTNDCGRAQDLELQTTHVFWEELLGDEFDSQNDSESDVEPPS